MKVQKQDRAKISLTDANDVTWEWSGERPLTEDEEEALRTKDSADEITGGISSCFIMI